MKTAIVELKSEEEEEKKIKAVIYNFYPCLHNSHGMNKNETTWDIRQNWAFGQVCVHERTKVPTLPCR